jgi:NADH-quinone oxidoreductase subunit L
MEGPTPVSALIHAATMVAAGVFLVARVYPLFSFGAINGVTPSLTVVVSIGVITALMASLIALGQFDIKRILAYSTVSQLGLMMVSLGVGGVGAGMMHLIAHGFFKALLFLGAGSVIHGLHHQQDIRKMGDLRRVMPVTFATYAIGMMTLSGVPLFFSGAWTKEEILNTTAHWHASHLPYYVILVVVFLTALYMTRQMIYVFFGNRGAAAEHAHESPPVMTMPLIALAICTIVFSVVLTPAWPWLHSYLTGETAHLDIALLIQPTLFLSLALVAGGIGLGIVMYRNAGRLVTGRVRPSGGQDRNRAAETDPLEHAQPALFRFLQNKMWLDEFYASTVIAFSRTAAHISDWMDRNIWDGLVRALGRLGQVFGIFTTNLDERGINASVDEATTGARGLGRLISARHSGQIQTYLGAIAVGMLALLILYAWLA